MSARALRLPIALLLLAACLATFLVVRALGGQQVGPAVALCPGPDGYGYTCDTNAAFDYIDADNDTGLYLDDGLTVIEMPFPFTFYGIPYEALRASSNGNLQFTTENPDFNNQCLSDAPVAGLGEMIAPYWDDLDLTLEGFVETIVTGTAPERIFVIEWDDVPTFENPADRVTFEVQLFESSDDIVFLYEDVDRALGDRGSSATIGLQSESLGYALQLGCNQLVLSSGRAVRLEHPGDPEAQATDGASARSLSRHGGQTTTPKGDAARLLSALNDPQGAALRELRAYWRERKPAQDSQWLETDMTGDGRPELVFLWQAPLRSPRLSHLAVLGQSEEGSWTLHYEDWPMARRAQVSRLRLLEATDISGDGAAEVILGNEQSGILLLVSAANAGWETITVPGRCAGDVHLKDANGDGVADIVRDRCSGRPQTVVAWGEGGLQLIGDD